MTFKFQVQKAVSEKKQIVFTGHSSGGSIAALAAIWFLEQCPKSGLNQIDPLCVTFGSPLIGDGVLVHALHRENWARCFLHFVLAADIVPRCLLAPLSNCRDEFQAILHLLCPKPLQFNLKPPIAGSLIAFYKHVLRNALSMSNNQACLIMGCTNPLLEVLTSFVKLTPYRPFGNYVFYSKDGRVVCLKNSNSILNMLFYMFQKNHEEDVELVAQRSLEEHVHYEARINGCLDVKKMVFLDSSDPVPLSLSSESDDKGQLVNALLKDLDLVSAFSIYFLKGSCYCFLVEGNLMLESHTFQTSECMKK